MSFIIDTDVRLPARKGGRPKDAVAYPFGRLEVGASFFVPGMSMAAQTAASNYARLHPEKRFATRVLECDPKFFTHGIRVWRTR